MRLPGAARWLADCRARVLAAALVLALVGLVVTRGYGRIAPATQGLGYTLLSLMFCLLVALAADADLNRDHWLARSVRIAPLRVLGKYSYGMYVFHWPLHNFIGLRVLAALHLERGSDIGVSLLYVGACSAATLLLAMLSYHGVEVRFLAMKHRFDVLSVDAAVRQRG
jgi:peptidoglycan/LPS O-acetylase OafA/YrhL